MNIIKNPETVKTPKTTKGSGMTVSRTEFTIRLMRCSWSSKDDRVNKMLDSQVHNLLTHLEGTLQNASAGSLTFWKEIFVLCEGGTAGDYEPWEIFPILRGCMQMIEEGTGIPNSVDERVDDDEAAQVA